MIIKAKDLSRELDKYPEAFVCVGKSGDELGRYDENILGVKLREDGVLIVNVENYNENGLLKFYRQ